MIANMEFMHFFNLLRQERARKLCSEDVIDKESAKLHEILQQNGYPKRFIAKYSICKSNKQSNYSVAKTDLVDAST